MPLLVNGTPVLRATIGMPLTGAWTARVELDAETADDFSGAVTIADEDVGFSVAGSVHRVGENHGRVEALIVGGAGGLGATLDARYYVGAPVQTILGDILREAGEALSTTSDSAALGYFLPKWTRTQSRAGAQLSDLLGPLDVDWRVLDDGSIWIGTIAWSASTVDYDTIAVAPSEGRWIVADDTMAIRPGTTLDDRRASFVEHVVMPDSVRSFVWFSDVS